MVNPTNDIIKTILIKKLQPSNIIKILQGKNKVV